MFKDLKYDMGNIKDLIGNKYGYLTVIAPTNKRIQRKVVWKCLCICGKECEVLSTNLTSGRTTSCGCMQYKIVAKHYREKAPKQGDIINETEILDVCFKPEYRGFNECYVLGKCKFCGENFWVKKTLLVNGGVKSCGCIRRSYGEALIGRILDENNIIYEREKIYQDCYFQDVKNKCRFDFYINNEYLLEFDGRQHFDDYGGTSTWFDDESLKKIKERDKYKNEWCKSHKIPLIRIPYYKLDSLNIGDLLLDKTTFLV